MKLEVGMYVRTKKGYICKLLKLNEPFEDDGYLDHNDIGSPSIQEKNVIKASHNIIDLIEVGDYVNGKEITEISDNELFFEADDMAMEISFKEEEIKSIVTKEQFESEEYIVNEDN